MKIEDFEEIGDIAEFIFIIAFGIFLIVTIPVWFIPYGFYMMTRGKA